MEARRIFQLSGFKAEKKVDYGNIITLLDGRLIEKDTISNTTTHLVCGRPTRSEKFLGGLAKGCWILTVKYLEDSFKAKKWQDEARYEWNTSKVSQVPKDPIMLGMLNATSRWRKHVAETSSGPFFGWRASVVAQDAKAEVFKRLLKYGGASIVTLKLPVMRAALVARDVSHVFVEESRVKDIYMLLQHGVLCLPPIYISIFLTSDPPPEPRDHLISTLPNYAEFINEAVEAAKNAPKSRKAKPSQRQLSNSNTPQPSTSGASNRQVTPLPKTASSSTTRSSPPTRDTPTARGTPPIRGTLSVKNSPISNSGSSNSNNTPQPKWKQQTLLVQRTPKIKSQSDTQSPQPVVIEALQTQSSAMQLKQQPQIKEPEAVDLTEDTPPHPRDVIGSQSTSDSQEIKPIEHNRRRVVGKRNIQALTIEELQQQPDSRGSVLELNNNASKESTNPSNQSSEHSQTADSPSRIRKATLQNPDGSPYSPGRLSLRKTMEKRSAQKTSDQVSDAKNQGTKSAKRKLDLPDGPKPKRRRLELPWSRACPDIPYRILETMKDKVVLQVSEAQTGLFDACTSENMINQSLYELQASTTTLRYPQPRVLHTVVHTLLTDDNDGISQRAYQALRHVLSLHPPVSPVLQQLYLVAMHGIQDKESHVGHEAWTLIKDAFTVMLDDGKNSEHTRNLLFLKFIVAAIESNMAAVLNGVDPRFKLSLSTSIWGEILWPRGDFGQYNKQISCLLEMFILSLSDKHNNKLELREMLQSLVSSTAHCCHPAGVAAADVSPYGLLLSREFTCILKSCVGEDHDHLRRVLGAIDLPWLRLRVVLTWLDLYDDSMLSSPELSNAGPLNLTKIVCHYFFLMPPMEAAVPPSPHPKSQTSQTASIHASPSQVKNQHTPTKRRSIHSKIKTPSAQNSPGKSEAALKRKLTTINKKNLKGETALHRACIKNDVVRVKELLQTPGIDVNVADHCGWTPLHEACNRGSVESVVELLKFRPPKTIASFFSTGGGGIKSGKVDLLAGNDDGITPLHDAVNNNQIEIVKILLQFGGKKLLEAKNKAGLTPLEITTEEIMIDVLKSADYIIPSSPCVTPRKRRNYIPEYITEDNSMLSQGSQSMMDSYALSIDPPTEESYTRVLSVTSSVPASVSSILHFITLLYQLLHAYMSLYKTEQIKFHIIHCSKHPPPLPTRLSLTAVSYTASPHRATRPSILSPPKIPRYNLDGPSVPENKENESRRAQPISNEDVKSGCQYLTTTHCLGGKTHTRCLCKKLEGELGVGEDHLMRDLGMMRTWEKHVSMLQDHIERIGEEKVKTDPLLKHRLSMLQVACTLR